MLGYRKVVWYVADAEMLRKIVAFRGRYFFLWLLNNFLHNPTGESRFINEITCRFRLRFMAN